MLDPTKPSTPTRLLEIFAQKGCGSDSSFDYILFKKKKIHNPKNLL